MRRADEFTGFFAEFYDILHAGLPDVDAYVGFARQYGPTVLELGCGTGRILVPLARAGFKVTGVDRSDDMLDLCGRKLASENGEVRSRAKLVKADIRGLELDGRFDLVIAPCNLMCCFVESGDAMKVLRAARKHLKDSGVFILDNSIPDVPFMVKTNRVPRTFDFTHPLTGTTIRDTLTANYDFVAQVEVDDIRLEEWDGDVLLRAEETTETLAFYFPREMRTMLSAAGLRVFREQGSLVENIPIDAAAGEMVFFCVASHPQAAGYPVGSARSQGF